MSASASMQSETLQIANEFENGTDCVTDSEIEQENATWTGRGTEMLSVQESGSDLFCEKGRGSKMHVFACLPLGARVEESG